MYVMWFLLLVIKCLHSPVLSEVPMEDGANE